MLKAILAAIGLDTSMTAVQPRDDKTQSAATKATTPLDAAATKLVTVCEEGVSGGRWDANEHTRHHAAAMLEVALEDGAGQRTIANLTLALIDEAIPAIAMGEWRASGDELEAIMVASGLATALDADNDDDDEQGPEAAA